MREPLLPLIASLCFSIISMLSNGWEHWLTGIMALLFALLAMFESLWGIRETLRDE